MNVQEALARLKLARAYSGSTLHARNFCTHTALALYDLRPGLACKSCCDRLDASYREAVNTLNEAIDFRTAYHTANETLVRALQESREELEAEKRRGAVSEQFRKVRDKRWDTSYTKKVVDKLLGLHNYLYTGRTPRQPTEVQEAIDLLTDYHNTMHLAYEQRDEARGTVAQLRAELYARIAPTPPPPPPQQAPATDAETLRGVVDDFSAYTWAVNREAFARSQLTSSLEAWKACKSLVGKTAQILSWNVAKAISDLIDAKLKGSK